MIRRSPEFQSHRIDDEVVLFNASTGVAHVLNDTAGFLWEQCETPTTPEALQRALQDRYDVTAARARKDVGAALASFRRLSLLLPAQRMTRG